MADVTRFSLDARTLRVEFLATLGPLPVRGRFSDVQGTLVLPGTEIERASIEVRVAAASLDTGLAMRDRHLRGRSFLDVARHPHITFTSHRVHREHGELRVAGTLVLRGRAREVLSFCPVSRVDGSGVSGHLALCGTFDVPLREHGISVPIGIDRLNPIFLAVGGRVRVDVSLLIPATQLLPALLPALGR